MFRQYPQWHYETRKAQYRWKLPVATQMAIIHQESKFDSAARPPRAKLLGTIPWKRPSSAYGYPQALKSTWAIYKTAKDGGSYWASRSDFSDSVDFIGWYANQANRRAGIPYNDTYKMYLAYHEGVGGYLRKSYLKKPWLIQVARKVKARAQLYEAQLHQCKLG